MDEMVDQNSASWNQPVGSGNSTSFVRLQPIFRCST